ncbi:amidase [Pseudomonas sp. RC10]|uniref:amidase n=1 Tax=Pseudomonas bambusae TaxID=3139142 RepID=UPI0031396651
MKTIAQLAGELNSGITTSQTLIEDALARIEQHRGAGGSAYISVDAEQARLDAIASDRARAKGHVPSPLAGLPVSIKDLFDVRGHVSRSGAKLLNDAPPAISDAAVVSRLRAVGAILLGRTNMSEFAFSGLGLNPHFGTPRNPFDQHRIAGGSSSGAAVSVAEGMAVVGLGTDTGGSIRIPSAFCGLTGFKPTASRVPQDGAFPLSQSLDSVGPLARSVADCRWVDGILSGETLAHQERTLAGLRLAVTRDYVLEGLDEATALAFDASLARLSDAGADIQWINFPELHQLPQINAGGGLTAAEAWHRHRDWLQGPHSDQYDARVAKRIRRGEALSAFDYLEIVAQRQRLIEAARQRLAGFDGWLMPTVPVVAPTLEPLLADEATFFSTNGLVLRNPSVINFLDGCALSLPCQRPGDLPVGLSVAGLHGTDAHILAVGQAIEACVTHAPNVR